MGMYLYWGLKVDLMECRRDKKSTFMGCLEGKGVLIGSGTDHKIEQICGFA